ncbi:MAG TPA: alanine racemase [Gemmatimonadaceae bacterium]|nr:alanine racemase [Gemmatimonadaceae bacterium]
MNSPSIAPRAWVEVDLGALVRNARELARRAGVPLLPMVKADAYGLGAAAVVDALESVEPWGYGVATVDEGVALRAIGIARPIIVFTPVLVSEMPAVRQAELRPALGDPAAIAAWAGAGPWHLSIDTGMNRAGLPWQQTALLAEALRANPPEGVFTHFHSAELDDGSTEVQVDRFRRALAALPARPAMVHVENSPALERLHAASEWTVVRPGVFLYGVGTGGPIAPEPVASLWARVVELRTIAAGESVSYHATYVAPAARRVATVAAGYADGYRRSLSNVGCVRVRGVEAPVVGTVTMDMIMVDVTEVPCVIGDAVQLIGDGTLGIESIAARAGLSTYEILVGLALRAPRVYTHSAPHGTPGVGGGTRDG